MFTMILQTPKSGNDHFNKAFFKKQKSLISSSYTNNRQVWTLRCEANNRVVWAYLTHAKIPRINLVIVLAESEQVSQRCQLEQGSYVILPTTFEPGEEGAFTLRVYSKNPIKLMYVYCSYLLLLIDSRSISWHFTLTSQFQAHRSNSIGSQTSNC